MDDLKTLISELKVLITEKELISEWYNDEQCWKLKGGGALSSFRSHPYYQPKGGIPDARVGGRKVWSRATVAEWLHVTDDQLKAYHEKYKTGAIKG